jgi:hypothetical protein
MRVNPSHNFVTAVRISHSQTSLFSSSSKRKFGFGSPLSKPLAQKGANAGPVAIPEEKKRVCAETKGRRQRPLYKGGAESFRMDSFRISRFHKTGIFRRNLSEGIFQKILLDPTGIFQNGIFQKESFRNTFLIQLESFRRNLSGWNLSEFFLQSWNLSE